ncbi:hypothetical protein [Arthrobacter sp. H5]|uniref:hypothetical protein n=1 Tax=Arthrobacter sp. H5 TaxID=1267973 RepID=UPI000489EB73|nr:hypothetical protein [Arthrobacter sp. H5]
MTPKESKARFTGKRVQFVGMFGDTAGPVGPVGKVWRVTSRGVWVTLSDGSRQQWHPEGIRTV